VKRGCQVCKTGGYEEKREKWRKGAEGESGDIERKKLNLEGKTKLESKGETWRSNL